MTARSRLAVQSTLLSHRKFLFDHKTPVLNMFIHNKHRGSLWSWSSSSVLQVDVPVRSCYCALWLLVGPGAPRCAGAGSSPSILGTMYSQQSTPCILPTECLFDTKRVLPQRRSVPAGHRWAPSRTLQCVRCLACPGPITWNECQCDSPTPPIRPM